MLQLRSARALRFFSNSVTVSVSIAATVSVAIVVSKSVHRCATIIKIRGNFLYQDDKNLDESVLLRPTCFQFKVYSLNRYSKRFKPQILLCSKANLERNC